VVRVGFSSEEGSRECAFFTFQQCLDTISGVGGFCYPSPYASAYDGPVKSANARTDTATTDRASRLNR